MIAALRSGAWLSRQRLLAYARILLALEVITFLFLVAGTHGWIVPLEKPSTTDFVSFYAAGSLADAGTPALAYDQDAHLAAEERATAPGIGYQFFYYPPVFLLLCALLARLPYLVAFLIFELASLALCWRVVRSTLPQEDRALIVVFLAFPAIFWTMGLGQNSFLTAALLGFALLQVDRRPVLSGIAFGLLCYKPHVGLLVPVALAAAGKWRAFGAAAVSALAVIGLSLLLFGTATWEAFLQLAAGSYAIYESGRIDFAGFVSPFGAVRLMGGGPAIAYAIQTLATLIVAAFVAFIWWKKLSLPIRAATLALGTLIAIPVVLVYDLMVAFIAMLWLVRAARASGYLPWQKSAIAFAFIIPLFARNLGTVFHLPLALASLLFLFGIALNGARRELAQRRGFATTARLKTIGELIPPSAQEHVR